MKYIITLPALLVSLLLLCSLRPGQALAHYEVNTVLGGLPLNTVVDSAAAQALLMRETALPVEHELPCYSVEELPSTMQLRQLSQLYSPDTAMAALARCLLQMPRVAQAQALFTDEIGKDDQAALATTRFLQQHSNDYVVIFVPGWGYLEPENPTGANLAMPMAVVEAQGFTTRLAPIPSNGSIEQGAKIVSALAWEILNRGKSVIFVSASSGGPIVAHAISTGGFREHPGLRGWLNICGVLNGSPTIDRLLFWPATLVLRAIALFEGWDYDNLVSLSRARSVPRFRAFRVPGQLTIVNYVGIPFSQQISRYGKLFQWVLRREGPNDGLTFITEAMAPGFTVLGIGTDHFIMEDPGIVHKTGSLLPVLLRLIENNSHAADSGDGERKILR